MLEYGLACREEEPDILDFANMVFSMSREPVDFLRLQPKVYTRPGFADISLVAREDGRIRGLVNAIHGTLHLGGDKLRYGYVGTVSAHPHERGRGIMKTLMNMVMERLAGEGCQFLALGGQRQRYGYFGFEDAGAAVTLGFTRASISHAGESEPSGAARLVRLEDAGEGALRLAKSLHIAQAMRCERRQWDFLELLHTEDAEPYAILRGEEPVGYLAAQEHHICEFACAQGADPLPAVAALLRDRGSRGVQMALPLHDLHRQGRLFAAADNWHTGPSCMVRVLDWTAFLSALLRFAAASRALREGEAVLGIQGHGNYRMIVRGGTADVQATQAAADFTAEPKATVMLLTTPLGSAMFPDNPLHDWLPLPLYMPEMDSF